ncbi:MAG: hypothetical protein IPM50_00390 [Acidobacteriota bacterium]|nr:MAG: hypothetical protein IPM50_00390 [Acidobacteriota bacterium]
MDNAKTLKTARDILLQTHKILMDMERELHEGIHGPVNPSQFLSLLLQDEDLAWLRRFSGLVAEIDELLLGKEGYSEETAEIILGRVRGIAEMAETDEYFLAKYQYALQRDPNSAILHGQLRMLFK